MRVIAWQQFTVILKRDFHYNCMCKYNYHKVLAYAYT